MTPVLVLVSAEFNVALQHGQIRALARRAKHSTVSGHAMPRCADLYITDLLTGTTTAWLPKIEMADHGHLMALRKIFSGTTSS